MKWHQNSLNVAVNVCVCFTVVLGVHIVGRILRRDGHCADVKRVQRDITYRMVPMLLRKRHALAPGLDRVAEVELLDQILNVDLQRIEGEVLQVGLARTAQLLEPLGTLVGRMVLPWGRFPLGAELAQCDVPLQQLLLQICDAAEDARLEALLPPAGASALHQFEVCEVAVHVLVVQLLERQVAELRGDHDLSPPYELVPAHDVVVVAAQVLHVFDEKMEESC